MAAILASRMECMGAGGPVGTGYQWMSWVHIDDIVDLFIAAAQDSSYAGVYNGTAPNPVRMSDLCLRLGETLNRPSWLPVPEFALQGLLADGAQIVLQGQKVLPVRTQQSGFQFKYEDIGPALRELVKS